VLNDKIERMVKEGECRKVIVKEVESMKVMVKEVE
jgi:hypothetical protein